MELDIALCLPREAETVAIVRDVAISALIPLGVTADCAEDLRLALSEACTNVDRHSESDDEYEARLQVSGRRCNIRVIDTGRGLDAQALLAAAPAPADSPSGRGISLMRVLVDTINFSSEPEAGTIVHLVKTLEIDESGPLTRLVHESTDTP